ncbi:MAG: CotH kinase family protein [Bacteroidota bacterium]
MIISDAEGRRAALAGPKWLAGLFLLVCCLLLLWWSHRSATSASNIVPPRPEQVFCDAEQREGTVFVNGPFQFSAGEKQTAEQAHSGQFSCKVDSGVGLQFGFSHQLQGYQPGDRFRASVWRHRLDERRGSYLVASAEGEGKFYLTANLGSKEDKGWEKLQLYFQLPLLKAVDNLKVYVYTDGKSPVYFDDLQIEKVGNLKDSLQQPLEVLQLQLGEKAMQKLATKRQEALREGILERADGDWVKGKLSSERQEEAQPVSVRLKGDWLDHLMGKKWSFRVKMKGGQSWNRLRLFSLHSPKARAHLMEWILHRLFEKEDVLTTRYDFVQLALNEDHLGVYAIEEHFDKVLLEYKHRREGPIVKFTEEGFWAGLKRSMRQFDAVDHELNQTVVEMENADIRPFNEKQTLANPRLAEAFEAAQKALQQYRYGLKTTAELFDLDLLARFYALCDLMGAYHGLAWHNQRFYFNPVTQLLEPIGYDGFGSHVPIRTTILGQGALNPRKIQEERLDNKLFQDKDFTVKYIQYLYRYNSLARNSDSMLAMNSLTYS